MNSLDDRTVVALPREKDGLQVTSDTSAVLIETAAARPRTRLKQRPRLDLWPGLATPGGIRRPEFTLDALRLNGDGYRTWVDVLRPLVTVVADGTGAAGG